jgi:hypothetical protein
MGEVIGKLVDLEEAVSKVSSHCERGEAMLKDDL